MLATGDIKKYQLVVGGLSLMAFPAAWFFFKIGFGAEWGYGAMIIFSVVCLIARLSLLQEMIPGFRSKLFIRNAILPIVLTTIFVVALSWILHSYIGEINLFVFAVESTLCFIMSVISIYFIGLSSFERKSLKEMVLRKIRHHVEK